MRPEDFRIGGFEPFSTVDYPGCIAAVVFAQGCPLKCFYCHNKDLLPATTSACHRWEEVEAFLMRRHGLLDAVVFSGGEPLAQAGLIPAMAHVRSLGFKVGLHTSGVYPARFAEALTFADWVGLDVKAGFDDYGSVTGVRSSGARARESLALLIASGVDHEVRTTVSLRAHTPASLMALATELRCAGVKRYAVQEERAVAHASVKREALALADLHTELSALFESFAYRCA